MIEVRVVPKGEVSSESASELADVMHWVNDREASRAASIEESAEIVWRCDGGTVSFVQDFVLRRNYFSARGADVESAARSIRHHFACYQIGEISEIAQRAEGSEELISALSLIAAAAPEAYNSSVFRAVDEGSEHSKSSVRLVAVLAASHLGWSQLRPVVERIIDSDPTQVLRDFGWNVLHLTQWNRGRTS